MSDILQTPYWVSVPSGTPTTPTRDECITALRAVHDPDHVEQLRQAAWDAVRTILDIPVVAGDYVLYIPGGMSDIAWPFTQQPDSLRFEVSDDGGSTWATDNDIERKYGRNYTWVTDDRDRRLTATYTAQQIVIDSALKQAVTRLVTYMYANAGDMTDGAGERILRASGAYELLTPYSSLLSVA